MENPSLPRNPSITTNPNHAVTPGGSATFVAGGSGLNATGRPPDGVSFDGLQESSEHPGSPTSKELQPMIKRGRVSSDPMFIQDSGEVVNKRRQNTPNLTSERVVDRNIRDPERSRSRFAALAGEHESIIEVEDGLERVAATELEVEEQVVRPRIVKGTIGGTTLDDKERMVVQRKQMVSGSDGYNANNAVDGGSSVLNTMVNGGSVSLRDRPLEELNVASKGKVVVAASTLPNDKHTAVMVVHGDEGQVHKGAKERRMKDTKSRKNGGARQRTTVADRLSPLVRELEDVALTESMRLNQPRNESNMEAMGLQWRPNSAFEQPSEADMQESLEHIASIHPPCDLLGEDRPQWRWELNRQFSSQSAYMFLNTVMTVGQQDIWKRIWKLHVPQRVRVFGWLSFHERLLTNVERVRRHCAAMDLCEICMNGSENIDHVLRRQGFGGESFLMRYMRYSLIFRSRRCSLVLAPAMGAMEDVLSVGNKLVLESELWAIHEGLMHAWSRGYRLVELESDSLEAVRIVLVNSPEVAVFGLVLSIKRWMSKDWRVKIQHVNHKGNRVADRMAAKSRTQRGLTATFSEVPADVRGLVDGEKPPSGVERVGLPEDGAIPYDPGGGINIC
ncbi:hypothetical protein V6N12_002897 [Hibiscus sabdariffa]|uniref:RNase H type-1 domain-containing protein n=1 Tax=Hibiscus sabdariffa TaxID=183260 RepID=A0ABR2EAS0_9ROSI